MVILEVKAEGRKNFAIGLPNMIYNKLKYKLSMLIYHT